MPLIYDCPMASTFAGVTSLQAAGVSGTGNALPNGIADSLYIANGWMVSHLRDTDTQVGLGQRCEITGPDDFVGDERWYAWDMMIPSGWPANGRQFSVMQIHDSPDNGDPARAPNFNVLYDGRSILGVVPAIQPPTQDIRQRAIGGAYISRDTPHRCALHVNWSKTGTGILDFYIDQQPIARKIDIGTAYDDVGGQYFKLGIYDYSHAGSFGERTAYFRNVKIWSGNPGHVQVLGGSPVNRSKIF